MEMAAEEIGSAPEGVTWVEVSDAGSNFFPYWATCRAHNKHFLIRVAQNRWVREQEEDVAHKLIDYARWLPAVAGSEHTISIPARKNQAAPGGGSDRLEPGLKPGRLIGFAKRHTRRGNVAIELLSKDVLLIKPPG